MRDRSSGHEQTPTPGEWIVETDVFGKFDISVFAGKVRYNSRIAAFMCREAPDDDAPPREEALANARLFAAAPKMADRLRQLEAENADLRATIANFQPGHEQTPGWQPIETAPRDSWKLHQMRAVGGWMHRIYGLIWGPLNYHQDQHHANGGYFIANGGEPTHWTTLEPLPAPPSAERTPEETE